MTPEPKSSQLKLTRPISSLLSFWPRGYFLKYQYEWIMDHALLKIIQKCRQAGLSYAAAYDCVKKASPKGARWDVWVSSRDETQAKLFVEDCKFWAKVLHLVAEDLGQV